jgi:hypothetical protein
MHHDKSSLAPEGKPVAFCLDPETGFSWIGEYDITADELLSGAGGNTATKTEQAERLILDLLADGKELASEDIVKAAAEAGISERTVQNAKRGMGGILGIHYLSLFEAKRDLSDDFLVRQLYYPFRVWSDRVTKTVKPVFLIFSNGMFNLYQYQFEDPQNYNSLILVKQRNYVIATEICLADIENLLRTVPLAQEPDISFPQADCMSRIVNLIELLNEKPMTKQDITSEYAFDERQTNYYTDAGRYLGLIDKTHDEDGNILFQLSTCGHRIMGLEYKERQLALVTQILMHKVFNETLKLHLQCGEMPDKQTIIQIMKRSNLYRVEADSTYLRRSSTVVGWVNWILGIIEE